MRGSILGVTVMPLAWTPRQACRCAQKSSAEYFEDVEAIALAGFIPIRLATFSHPELLQGRWTNCDSRMGWSDLAATSCGLPRWL